MRIAQISDTHISLDVPSRTAELRRCVAQINALDPLPDVVIHSGDISHDGLPEQFAVARELLQELKVPWFVMAGNRDNRPALIAAFSQSGFPRTGFPFVQFAVEQFALRIVCVDTLSDNSNKGDFCQTRLNDLEELLAGDRERPTAVFMHHPPFEVTAIPDPFQFVDKGRVDSFLDIIARHQGVRGLYCGHVHRRATTKIGMLPVEVMTAVALDLRKGKLEPVSDETPLYVLHDIEPV